MVRATQKHDERSWVQTAHQMSLLYNINRGKAKALNWDDFHPYQIEEDKRPVEVIDIANGIPPIFDAMKKAFDDGK